MKTLRQIIGDIALLLGRIAVGAILMLDGWRRMMGEGGMGTQIQYLAERQVPAPEVMAWGATIMELGVGLFLIFGLLTPILGILVFAHAVLIIVWTNWFNGPFGTADGPGFEADAFAACLGLVFIAYGGGRASMDQLFKRPKELDDDEMDEVVGGLPEDAEGRSGSTLFGSRD